MSRIPEATRTLLPVEYYLSLNSSEDDFRSVVVDAFYDEFGDSVYEKATWWFWLNRERESKGNGETITLFHHLTPVGVLVLNYQPCEILCLAIRKAFQGQGLAKLLCQIAINRATQKGKPSIFVSTRSKIAYSVYTKFGFVECRD